MSDSRESVGQDLHFNLVDVLLQEHASMRKLLGVMEAQASKDSPDHTLLKEILHYCETYPGAYHHPKEDLIYEALCEHAPAVAETVEDLEAEHVVMDAASRQILDLVSRAAEGDNTAEENLTAKVRAYVRFYRLHMRREERDFFPKALEVLTAEQWLALESRVVNPTDPYSASKSEALMAAFLARAPAVA